jgi:hypothetical protein
MNTRYSRLTLLLVTVFVGMILVSCDSKPHSQTVRDLEVSSQPIGPMFALVEWSTLPTQQKLLNENSTLQRVSYVINDPQCPVKVTRAAVVPRQKHSGYTDEWYFDGTAELRVESEIKAYSVAFSIFDAFGDAIRGFYVYDIEDLKPKSVNTGTSWRAYNENEPQQYLTVITFVKQVRRADGSVWEADADALEHAARKIIPNLKKEALKPPDKPKGKEVL